jgi:hypothetical protein
MGHMNLTRKLDRATLPAVRPFGSNLISDRNLTAFHNGKPSRIDRFLHP